MKVQDDFISNLKFYRKEKYLYATDFNRSFKEIANDLFILNYPKLFNKFKDKNIKQYYLILIYPYFTLLKI